MEVGSSTDEPIPMEYWGLVWEDMKNYFEIKTNTLLNGGKIDTTCKDPRRFYFLGKEGRHFQSHVNEKGYNFGVNLPEIIERKNNGMKPKKERLKYKDKKA